MRNSEFGIKDTAPNSAFRIPNYAQRRAGRPRSSPSPLRGELMWYNKCVALRYGMLPLQRVDTEY
ncbi:MAG: hypothetical protein LBQ66_04110 [Planctomycetaceae bacterium]|nr:hypothetical protein [Planctomycetaceae bacterium]